MNKKIKNLITELQQEYDKQQLNTVFLVSDDTDLTINAGGVLGYQIVMARRFIEQEAEKLSISAEELQFEVFRSLPEDDEDV